MGNSDAKINIIAFLDFDCPHCREAYSDFEKMRNKYSSLVKVTFKYTPLQTIALENPMLSANAGACADEQGKFEPYYKMLFENTGNNMQDYLGYAEVLDMDIKKFNLCLSEKTYQENINNDLLDVYDMDFLGTPTYIIDNSQISGTLTLSDWDQIILQKLK